MDGQAELVEAIEGLYTAFAGYPLVRSVDVCDHCHSPEEVQRTRARPLRELTWEDLDPLASDVLLTWGDVAELKHFLPRLFELETWADNALLGIEPLFGKLDRGKWSSWSAPERTAVSTYLDAFWRATLAGSATAHPAGDVLTAMACAGVDSAAPTALWAEARSEAALTDLVHFVMHEIDPSGVVKHAWWPDDRSGELREWANSAPVATALVAAMDLPDVEVAESAELLLSVLPYGAD